MAQHSEAKPVDGGKRKALPLVPLRDAVYFPRLVNALHVAREGSKKAVQKALAGGKLVLCVSQKEITVEDPTGRDLNEIGTLCEILSANPLPDGGYRIALRGKERIRIASSKQQNGAFTATYQTVLERGGKPEVLEALSREVLGLFTFLVEEGHKAPPEAVAAASVQEDPGTLADVVTHHLPLRPSEKQTILDESDIGQRLRLVHAILERERSVLAFQQEIRESVQKDVLDCQREVFLREQLRVIQDQLRSFDTSLDALGGYRTRFGSDDVPLIVRQKAAAELARLEQVSVASPEGSVVAHYLDWLQAMPWEEPEPAAIDLAEARKILNQRHYGLEKTKARILDHLAVLRLKPDARAPILCFVGPPGVGKTSLGHAVAEALNRPFVSVSLGGIRDDAEIRGHRRTYVGAMPGRIVQGLRQCGARNPVFVLDEIDKVASDFRGDPASALLEALDPSQNHSFTDLFLEVPVDLSKVFFIVTANTLEGIPAALLDRLEPVFFGSYTPSDRSEMARVFLIPRALEEHGLTAQTLRITDSGLDALISQYPMEAGVRGLSRRLAALCRRAARRVAEGLEEPLVVDEGNLASLLGELPVPLSDESGQPEVGSAKGMVVSAAGGALIAVEAALLDPVGPGWDLSLTGNLGEVMRESAQAALTYIRSIQKELSSDRRFGHDVHIHVPEGAVPKDGPSAGLAIAVALASAFADRPSRSDVAYTGEVTLRGRVLAVGGIREKLVAVHRHGLKAAVVPKSNANDLEELPVSVRQELQIVLVDRVDEALAFALA